MNALPLYVARRVQLEKNPTIRYLRLAAAVLCLVNVVFIVLNQEAAINYDQQQPFAASIVFTVLVFAADLFTVSNAFVFHHWVRLIFGVALVALGVYSVVTLSSSIHFSRDPETNQVCKEYGGNTKTCALLTVQSVVLVMMFLVVGAEVWTTFQDRTAQIKESKIKAEEDRQEIELESQRMKDILEEHRNRQQEQAVLDGEL